MPCLYGVWELKIGFYTDSIGTKKRVLGAEFCAIAEKIIPSVTNLIKNDYSLITRIVKEFQFKRIIFLGSNTLKGVSQESQLKMLELTQGAVVTMFDSLLGFDMGLSQQ